MSDKELDNLFREAAEGYKIQEDQAAWSDMSSRLDETGGIPSFWNWKTISSLTLIGLTSVTVLWYSESETNDTTKLQVSEQSVTNESKPPESNLNFEAAFTENASISKSKPVSQVAPAVLPSDKIKEGNTQTAIARSQEKSDDGEDLREDSQNHKTRSNHSESPAGVVSQRNNKQGENTSAAAFISSAVLNEASDQSVISNQPSADRVVLADSFMIDSISVSAIPLPENDSVSSKSESLKKADSHKRSISIKLSVSPDFSSIKYFTPDKSGINFGVLVGYNFNDRWSLVSGAISSRKIYSSSEIDKPYTTPKGYDYPVVKLTGDCRVLDIPLNVYYTFYQHKSLSFRAGLGVSSYLMFSEDYTYYVDNPYGSDMYSQTIDHENDEWFKMANISVAIQKRLNNHFYIELEPFMKAPLSGIGEGKVSLVTLGAFINIRYDIHF